MKVSPTRGVVRFGKRGKLSPRFIAPFEIVQRIGECAYRFFEKYSHRVGYVPSLTDLIAEKMRPD